MQARYQIEGRAKIAGLSVATLRALERRYQAVVPERTERVRQYGPAQIERLPLRQHFGSERACYGCGECAGRYSRSGAVGNREVQLHARARTQPAGSRSQPRDLAYQLALPLIQEVGIRWHPGTPAIAGNI
jgi:hypothetical protein